MFSICSESQVVAPDKAALAIAGTALAKAAKQGSAEAFEKLANLYSRRLFRQIFAIVRNHEDAEDALQDTFFRAFMALRSFEERSHVYTWLSRIAVNAALQKLRKRRSRPEVTLDDSNEALEHTLSNAREDAIGPDQHFEAMIAWRNTLDGIGKLNPTLRYTMQVFLARECSVRELANVLGVSVAAAKTRLYRARVELRLIVPGGGGAIDSGRMRHRYLVRRNPLANAETA
jgi:RNA polymerase sigma-70 factor, ECF subfamily